MYDLEIMTLNKLRKLFKKQARKILSVKLYQELREFLLTEKRENAVSSYVDTNKTLEWVQNHANELELRAEEYGHYIDTDLEHLDLYDEIYFRPRYNVDFNDILLDDIGFSCSLAERNFLLDNLLLLD